MCSETVTISCLILFEGMMWSVATLVSDQLKFIVHISLRNVTSFLDIFDLNKILDDFLCFNLRKFYTVIQEIDFKIPIPQLTKCL